MKFADQYPLAAFETCVDGPVKVAVIGQVAPVEEPPWAFDYRPFEGEVELWIEADMTPCYHCEQPTRFFV